MKTNEEHIKNIVEDLRNKDFKNVVYGFTVEANNQITDSIKEELGKLSKEDIMSIQSFLEEILNYCYGGKLFNSNLNSEYSNIINNLSEKELFLLKVSLIYYIGRISNNINLDLLKKVYYLDNNKYIKLDVAFSTLLTFDEEIELDFVNKLYPGSEYDKMIRSWTLAFFKNVNNPYEYVDNEEDNWEKARTPRIKRLKITSDKDPKYKKAIAFRLLDLEVIYLFLENRKNYRLTTEEKEIIKKTSVEYEAYSTEKKKLLKDLKNKILEY